MNLTIDEYYDLVSDLMTQSEFEERIKKYNNKYSDLLSDSVLAHLIVDELGRNVSNFLNISDLKPGTRVSLFATVTSPEPKVFTLKRDNRSGAQVNISDPTGRARLILWDTAQIEQVQNNNISVGIKLKILNAKISKSTYGLDLTLDRYESLIIDPNDFPEDLEGADIDGIMDISSVDDDGLVSIMGTISEKSDLRTFNRKNNTTGQVLNIKVYDGTGSIKLTLWDDAAKAANDYLIGDQIKIINGYSKLHNSVREIHSSYHTQITKLEES
jgi:replication factor A1